jgi:Na+(H+)/acetate symporter ActP
MIDYIRREIKFIVYLAVIFVLVLVVFPLITGQKPGITWNDVLRDQRMLMFLGLILAYALIYPLIAYTKVKRHLNGTFNDSREVFEKAFETLQYIKTLDTPEKIVYRKKSHFTRFVQWYEDSIVILPTENPVIMSGMRKSVTRIDRIIDHLLMKASE